MPPQTPAEAKDQRITMRVSATERELLARASSLANSTLSEFILDAATLRAEDILAARQRFDLTSPAFDTFISLLDRPVVDKPRLRRLLAGAPIFEGA